MKKSRCLEVAIKTLCSTLLIFLYTHLQAQNPNGIVTIKSGAVLNIGKAATLVTNSDIDNKGTMINSGSFILNGNTAQSFPGNTGSVPLMSMLEVKNTGAGILLNQNIKIAKELKLTSGNLALGNYDITIQSDFTLTAAVAAIGVGAGVSYGTGRFIVERFINLGTGAHGKSWQLLSVPANGQTIKDTWQESGAATVGYGTQMSASPGVAGGYDVYSQNPSIKTFSSTINNFDAGPSSTLNLIDNPKGYMLFVRGDRTVASGTGTTPTTLRIKGTLFTPANPPLPITVSSGKLETIGNPYASQIDFTLLTRTGGVANVFYTWDPSMSGAYGVGGYQTMSATNSWISVPGGGNYAGEHKHIESGQAFFVKSHTTAGTVDFGENVKTGGSILLNRTSTVERTANRQFIRSTLLTNTGMMADGNAAAFDSELRNDVDADDAIKMMNGGANFGLRRESLILSVEGRNLIAATDTLFYFTSNLYTQSYTFLIVPENMDLTKEAWLLDDFLQTRTLVSLSDSNYINFSVTSDPLSKKTDRFMLVFRPQTVLAISATTLQAVRDVDGSINVNWKTAVENDVKEYTVEKSRDDMNFNAITTKNPLMNNGAEANYSFKDMLPFDGNNFYRIKIVSLNADMKYSEIVKVAALKNLPEISVYPNPTTGGTVNLYLASPPSGSYNVVLINEIGQRIWTGKISNNSNSRQMTLQLPKTLAAGNYFLSLFDREGKSFSLPLILL